jgi:shikimate kinase / 3-dehydroquinate synthase
MRPVVLSGFMGTGKTTLGPALAERLGVGFVDTDLEIARAAGKSIPQIWREDGEAEFRRREAALIERLLVEETPRVIAFGGGSVTLERTRRLAADRALVVTLTASPQAIVMRIADVAARPNLAIGGDPVVRTRELLAERAAAYAECHLTVDTEALGVDAAVSAIVALVARDPLLVPLGTRSYDIDVCDGAPERLTEAILRQSPSSLLVVTDSNVERARGAALDAALRPIGIEQTRVTLPPGEAYKTLASVGTIWDAALGAGIDRDALVVAVGGGVVGDLAGFAAACLLRGVRFVQAPTTLLAMLDASVGGKTGFDHPTGKNLVGAFHQPTAVVADLAHLTTLPDRERVAGLAEAVKVALVVDEPLLERLERRAPALARGDRGELAGVVRAAVQAKIRVVRDDERESGARALLNLGHTVGHALETHGGYSRWLHGEAVALGLVAELRAMVSLGLAPASLLDRTRRLLSALGLPSEVALADVEACFRYVGADKKRTGDGVRLAVVDEVGKGRVQRVSLSALRGALLAR